MIWKEFRKMNLPNKLTLFRMVLVVPFVILLLAGGCYGWTKWIALLLFCVASATDTADGMIARRYGLITDFGKFMDPLADKLLVCSAMICLVSVGRLYAWVCILIIAREFIISGFRLVAADNNVVIAASFWGKIKTVFQMAMIILLIMLPAPLHQMAVINLFSAWWRFVTVLAVIAVAASVALTVISLVDYILKNRSVLSYDK